MGEGILTEKTQDGTEVYNSEVHACLQDYIDSHGIEDMAKESQSKWNAALIYINNKVFKGTDKLKSKAYDSNNLVNGGRSNNNKYDLDIVNKMCDYYITLCYEYEKEVSINGFSFMTGISTDCIRGWSGVLGGGYETNGIKASSTGLAVYKKLIDNNEESLSSILISGKRPPVAILGALNRRHGWNMGQPQSEEKDPTRPQLTAQEIHQARLERKRPEIEFAEDGSVIEGE